MPAVRGQARRGRAVLPLIALAALGLLAAGCASKTTGPDKASRAEPDRAAAKPAPKSAGYFKVGTPYQVNGIWYHPAADYEYVETGVASWYGPGFHGRMTANGERYDQNDLTAAHPTLPMPSLVRVTNLENGRALVVRVNDRGPFARGRIIDMSRRSAQLLGFERAGTAKVRVEVLPEESRQLALAAQQGRVIDVAEVLGGTPEVETAMPRVMQASLAVESPEPQPAVAQAVYRPAAVTREEMPPPVAAPVERRAGPVVSVEPVRPSQLFVQAGAFAEYDNASRLRVQLASLAPTNVTPADVGGRAFYRVRLGPVETVEDADFLLDQVIRSGFPEARLVVVE